MLKKKQKIYEKVGCFLNMAKGCFFVSFFFAGSNVFVVCFCVFGTVPKVSKMLAFPNLGGFYGVVYSCLGEVEGLGVSVFLVFCFSFV